METIADEKARIRAAVRAAPLDESNYDVAQRLGVMPTRVATIRRHAGLVPVALAAAEVRSRRDRDDARGLELAEAIAVVVGAFASNRYLDVQRCSPEVRDELAAQLGELRSVAHDREFIEDELAGVPAA